MEASWAIKACIELEPGGSFSFQRWQELANQRFKNYKSGSSLMVQWLRFHARSAGPIPGPGTMILHAAQHGLKNEKEKTNATQLYQEHTLSGLSWSCDKTDAVGLNPFLYKAYLFVDKQYWRWDERT